MHSCTAYIQITRHPRPSASCRQIQVKWLKSPSHQMENVNVYHQCADTSHNHIQRGQLSQVCYNPVTAREKEKSSEIFWSPLEYLIITNVKTIIKQNYFSHKTHITYKRKCYPWQTYVNNTFRNFLQYLDHSKMTNLLTRCKILGLFRYADDIFHLR